LAWEKGSRLKVALKEDCSVLLHEPYLAPQFVVEDVVP